MKSVQRKFIVLILCGIALFASSCSNSDSADGNNKTVAMGRYVEQEMKLPENVDSVGTIKKRSDGSMDVFMYEEINEENNEEGNLWNPNMRLYNTSDGVNWILKETPWYNKVLSEYGAYWINFIAYDKDDNVYLLISGDQDIVLKIVDDSIEEISMKWKIPDGESKFLSFRNFEITDDGDLLVSQYGIGVVKYGMDGIEKSTYPLEKDSYNISSESVITMGNKTYIKDMATNSILIYDDETDELISSVAYENMTEDTGLAEGKDGSIYLYNRSGIYRLVPNGSIWEKIIDGELTSMSIPSMYFSDLTEISSNKFYISIGDGYGVGKILKYVYDENTPTVPDTELVVYSLEESGTLRQAAGEFQQKNANVKVNIHIGYDKNSAATKEDAIKALNTELLLGKGPDVIILDGMPIDSYIEKGVLADLSGAVKSSVDSGEKLLDNIIKAYKYDEKIYALPVKFKFPVMWINEEYASSMKTLQDVVDFTENHKDLPLCAFMEPDELIQQLHYTCAPSWIKDNSIQDKEFVEFLESVKKISSKGKKLYTDEQDLSINSSDGTNYNEIYNGVFDWAYGRTHSYMEVLSSCNSIMVSNIASIERGGGIAVQLPGQVQNVYIPTCIAGINAKTALGDVSKDFVKTLLSQSVQSARLYDGFPVNEASHLDVISSYADSNMYLGASNTIMNENLEGPTADEEAIKKIMDLCLDLTTPSVVDEILIEMIIDETDGYFKGEKTVDETLQDVKEKTKLYLTE